MLHTPINPAKIRPPFAAYSHGVHKKSYEYAEMLFTSGQLGISPEGIIPDDVEAQAVLCFENIRAILREGGMDFSHVVRFSAYVTDRAYFPIYGVVRARYVAGTNFASTLLVVSGFTHPDFKIEVEATAAK